MKHKKLIKSSLLEITKLSKMHKRNNSKIKPLLGAWTEGQSTKNIFPRKVREWWNIQVRIVYHENQHVVWMYNKAIIAEHQLFKKIGQRENVKRKKRIIWMHMSREINLYASRKGFYINSYKDVRKKSCVSILQALWIGHLIHFLFSSISTPLILMNRKA